MDIKVFNGFKRYDNRYECDCGNYKNCPCFNCKLLKYKPLSNKCRQIVWKKVLDDIQL